METEDFSRRAYFEDALAKLYKVTASKKRKAKVEDLTDDCLKQWATEICENVSNEKPSMPRTEKQMRKHSL